AFTGEEIWVTEPFTNAWGMYDETGAAAYEIFYTMAYDGMIHAYDIKTGRHLWDYYTGSAGYETPYGHWPFYVINGWAIADGKIFAATGEHSPDSPLMRGYRLHVVDAFTGKPVWNISGYWMFPAVAEGYLVVLNGYDMQIYCFGKGKTKVTVEAPSIAVTKGSSVVIRGKVLDDSPALKGTPCVADEDMTPWIEYLLMQKPMPQKVKGVVVQLYAILSNGTAIYIGETITDPLNGGIFSYLWTPPDEGVYTITAVFPGTKSYWESCDSTAIGVVPAAETQQPEVIKQEAPTYTVVDIMIIIGVIIAIAIGIANLYTVRKSKK
ncbi:PQQ-like beta-propeller repeat protein, partial [Candidatus Bathyarchaeota archaeon]|nr:PQQ-like beta-propeller repeat protein [Candidatus Bathyarchaeota archaeon]